MSLGLRALEYLPSGFFEVRFSVEFANEVYQKWATTILPNWNPKQLEKIDESQSFIVYSNKEVGGGGWLSDYCTLRIVPGSSIKKAQVSVTWTPGNNGTHEAFSLLDRVVEFCGANIQGDFYIGDEGYALEHKGKLSSEQLKALLGTTKPEWKISEVQEKALEYFVVELTDKGAVFKNA